MFLTQLSYSQVTVTVPLSTVDYQNGAYLKDLSNELHPYIGVWEGVLNNKKYTFVFQIFEQHLTSYAPASESYHYEDVIMGKFKVTDLVSNSIIYSSLNAINYEDFPIHSGLPYYGLMKFIFKDTSSNCENSVQFYLRTIPNNPNVFSYCNFGYNDWWRDEDCPYTNRTDIPVHLPTATLILTKL